MAEPAEKANVTALRRPEAAPAAPPPAATTATEPRGGRRRPLRWALLVAGPALVAAGVGWSWLAGGRYVGTDNAYVHADMVSVATDVSGLVRSVEVRDNERVAPGQVLFTLDDTSHRHALARAQANLDSARADIEALRASHEQKLAEIAKTRGDVAYYEKEFGRQQDLVERRVATQTAFDAARHSLDTARGDLAALEQERAAIVARLDGDPEAPVERHPGYQAALAMRDQAQRDLDRTVVKAPVAGVTAQVPSLQPGEYLPAGQAAFALVADDHVWVEANPKETDLTHVVEGQPVEVTVDTYPGHVWRGTVASLSPASQSQFSLLPAQNASGNWVKVVQRIPLRVRVETSPGEPVLRAGMSAEIEIDTGHRRKLTDLLSWFG